MVVRDYMTSDVVHVEIPGNRDDVLKILKRTGISGVPVIKHKKIVGIITRKDLLQKPEETQLGLLMTSKPLTIAPDADISDAARILVTKKIRRLPVVEDGHLLGLLSVADLIHAIAQKKIKEEIKDTYTSQTFALWEETPLPVVGRVMEISGVDAIPILDAENRLQGIISERDLIRAARRRPYKLRQLPVLEASRQVRATADTHSSPACSRRNGACRRRRCSPCVSMRYIALPVWCASQKSGCRSR